MTPLDQDIQRVAEGVSGLHPRLDRQDETLAEIKAQVKATNGRVMSLERWQIATEAVDRERLRRSEHGASSRLTLFAAFVGGPATALIALLLDHFAR
jgi:hypothetical protein